MQKKNVPLAKKVDLLLLGIYLFYEKSSLNRSMLKCVHKICQVPARVGGTRWLPHMLQALEHLLKSYKAIVLHMQQIQNPDDPANHKDSYRKAKNYLLLLTCADIVQYLHLLLDMVRCLLELFQHGQTNISAIVNEIQPAVDVLKYLTWPGPSPRRIMEGDTTMFQGEKLSGRSNTFKTARCDMLTSLISSLNIRFIDMASTILQNTWILNFKLWPAEHSGNEDFGDNAMQALAKAIEKTLMEAEVNPTLVEDEWTVLKVKFTRSVGNLNPDKAIASLPATGARRVDGYAHTAGCSTVEDLDDNNELNEEHVQEMLVQMQ
ncbi:Zinc finger protein 862-like 8 [Homarus americanus]|uniref:Zinc finger protein 862-like 8 n=1 Tax=Homarus americanus TaxID=6706 RepID=A0A8J5MUY1_HOMAM|nr:Zinc finger protein 862-like 8 [Homarus americanus]